MDWSSLSGADGARAARDERRVRSGFWDKLGRHASYIPFAEEAVAAYYAAFDKATPLHVRATLLGALAYFVLPFDLAPDLLPLVGFGDDAAVLMGAFRLLSDHIRPHHHAAARAALSELRAAKAE
ncbi:YkvA family protein [Xanthobacter pseudotagetidis]|uniref:YkvA family protein n=1 Tax=Xanthobacter pseudotagetidis TaxID=3119911 RepID=UPI00372AE32A